MINNRVFNESRGKMQHVSNEIENCYGIHLAILATVFIERALISPEREN